MRIHKLIYIYILIYIKIYNIYILIYEYKLKNIFYLKRILI